MPMPPPQEHKISLDAAAALTRRFRTAASQGTELGAMFPREVYDRLLAQPGCAGIRMYYGLDDQGKSAMVLVGVDKDGNDMVNGELDDVHYPCPPFCDGTNALNS